MKRIRLKSFKTFLNSKKNLRIIYSILTMIALYYSLIAGIYLLFFVCFFQNEHVIGIKHQDRSECHG